MGKDAITVWRNCLETIRRQVNDSSYSTWFLPIVPISLVDNTLTIQVPSQFFYEWLETHHVNLLRQVIHQELGPGGNLNYSVIVDRGNANNKPIGINLPGGYGEQVSNQNQGPRKVQGNSALPEIRSPFDVRPISNHLDESQLNPVLTFDNYVEGTCNRLARSAGQAVAAMPGATAFNPLLIYGGVGLGKTHLMHAIGNRIKQITPEKFVLYVSTQKFTDQFVEHTKNNRMQDFNDFYMQVDVLLLDDVQLLVGKPGTQEILFTMFNHLHQRNRQIIITSDCAPKDLKGLTERLHSRLKWGLTADLQLPDFETRIAIIQKKCQGKGLISPVMWLNIWHKAWIPISGSWKGYLFHWLLKLP